MQSLRTIPLVDHHCHAFLRTAAAPDPPAFRQAFTEAADPTVLRDHLPYTPIYRWVLREAARLLGCAATEEAVLAARVRLDLGEYTRTLFDEVRYAAFFLETGFRPDAAVSPDEFAGLTGCPSHAVLRLETAAEGIIAGGAGFDDLVEQFSAGVADLRRRGYIGAKSIAAYRTGLAIAPPTYAEAAAAYAGVQDAARAAGRVRLASKPVIDYLLWRVLPILGREEIPLQVHVGYGDTDADLRLGNPLHLRAILEAEGLRRVPVILLHNYPYIREAGYLASVYPNVYLDVSLAIPLALSGAERFIAEALELAPATKLLFASDAHSVPELFWAAARAWRTGLERVLGRMVADGYLTPGEAENWAWLILCRNALRIYHVSLQGVA